MALATHEQFLSTLERSKRPLIVLAKQANVDDFSTAFGIAALLSKLQKPIDIATSGGSIPKSLDFLHAPFPVRGNLPNIRKLTLCVNAKQAKVDELSYDIVDDQLHIHLLPKSGHWSENDVSVKVNEYRYDLIITIGAHDLDSIGRLYEQYADFFFQTPIVNIDHHPSNEHFGQLNLVNINAVACSEVCHDLFTQIDKSLLDEEIATYFLTGMIAKTKSFRSDNVTPKTLKVAGDLIAAGARRDEIVEHLYKTRTVETLRLWGRALARLKSSEKHHLTWTLLTKQDFTNAGTDESALDDVIDELIMSSPSSSVAVLFYEHKDGYIEAIMRAERPYDALYLGAPFRAAGTREEARLKLTDKDLVTAEKNVITHVTKQLEHQNS